MPINPSLLLLIGSAEAAIDEDLARALLLGLPEGIFGESAGGLLNSGAQGKVEATFMPRPDLAETAIAVLWPCRLSFKEDYSLSPSVQMHQELLNKVQAGNG